MIAILQAYKAGLFNSSKNILRNIFSGVIVGIVALPLAMAFAIASGVTPQQGIYTAIVAGLCVSLFGGSRVQIAGPTGAFIVILASITAKYGVLGLQIASLMAGLLLILMGILRLGSVIKYIPEPVIIGFTAGIAIIIWVGQWRYFFGLDAKTSGLPFYKQFYVLIQAFPHLNLPTTALSTGTLVLLLIIPRFIKKIPAPLIAMIIISIVQSIFHFPGVATLGNTYGAFPRELPHFQALHVSFGEITALILPAFTIALLGAIESLLSAVVADGMLGIRHQPNQELIGQGIANVFSPLFGGFAATGAIARTVTNIRNGGNSPLAGIVHSVFLVLVVLIFAPFASNIPLGCLAAILFVVAYNMSEWRRFLWVCRYAPYYDVLVLLVSFLLTVFVNLVVAVNIGVILASLLFMGRMAQTFVIEEEKQQAIESDRFNKQEKGTVTFTLNGPLFFGAVSTFEQALEHTHDKAEHVIIDMKNVPFIDSSGLLMLQNVFKQFRKHGVSVKMKHINPRIRRKIIKAGLLGFIK